MKNFQKSEILLLLVVVAVFVVVVRLLYAHRNFSYQKILASGHKTRRDIRQAKWKMRKKNDKTKQRLKEKNKIKTKINGTRICKRKKNKMKRRIKIKKKRKEKRCRVGSHEWETCLKQWKIAKSEVWVMNCNEEKWWNEKVHWKPVALNKRRTFKKEKKTPRNKKEEEEEEEKE